MSDGAWVWWGVMVACSIFNISLLFFSRSSSFRQLRLVQDSATPKERRFLSSAAVIFTFVCAYRAILPRVDVPRLCIFNTPLNWVVFGRACATVAEVAWVAQFALTIHGLASGLHAQHLFEDSFRATTKRISVSVVVLACVAECCSWTNLITESNLFAVFEQFLWAVLFIVIGIRLTQVLREWADAPQTYWIVVLYTVMTGIEQGYESFGLYLPRYLEDQKNHVHYQTFVSGFKRLVNCAKVSQNMKDWEDNAFWMTVWTKHALWGYVARVHRQ